MAYKSLRMDLMDKIAERHLKGVPKKQIARLLGISKNTVKKYLELVGDTKAYLQLSTEHRHNKLCGAALSADRESTLKALLPQIHRELGRRQVTRQLWWKEYKALYPDGGLCR